MYVWMMYVCMNESCGLHTGSSGLLRFPQSQVPFRSWLLLLFSLNLLLYNWEHLGSSQVITGWHRSALLTTNKVMGFLKFHKASNKTSQLCSLDDSWHQDHSLRFFREQIPKCEQAFCGWMLLSVPHAFSCPLSTCSSRLSHLILCFTCLIWPLHLWQLYFKRCELWSKES